MNASAFVTCGHLTDVLKVHEIARAVGEHNLRTFKTRVTINHEMPEQAHAILIYFSQQNYSIAVFPFRIALYNQLMRVRLDRVGGWVVGRWVVFV